MSAVQIRNGDMFDGPSDLIVLPCSTEGTITSLVREKLARFDIPIPRRNLRLGEVELFPFNGGESIAQYVAFAASVQGRGSSLSAIHKIGDRLGRLAEETEGIRRVASPLLGAGAGGLDAHEVLSALSNGFRARAPREAILIISVLDKTLFATLTRKKATNRQVEEDRPIYSPQSLRVFVSYAHGTEKHQDWVRGFATFLRKNGVDARLDEWHLRAGMDLPQFMANELSQADRVILVSDEHYADKANGRVGGVGWETMLIQGDMSRLPPDSRKYVAVVRTKRVDEGMPMYMRTKFVLHWPTPDLNKARCEKLLRELFDRVAVPPIGPRPVFVD